MIKSLEDQLGGRPESVRKQGMKYLTHVTKLEQSNTIQKITHIDKHKVTVEIHPSFNSTKRIIYTPCYTLKTDLKGFAAGLAKDFGATELT